MHFPSALVVRAFLRYLPRRRALTAVQLLGIAVGVASATGMFLSARTALDSFTQAVTGVGLRGSSRNVRVSAKTSFWSWISTGIHE